MSQSIYFDYASATPVDPRVLAVMLPYFTEHFANPASLHHEGRQAKKAVDKARHQVASAIGAKAEDVIFTAGGTEANNLAIFGVAQMNQSKPGHVICSAIEHQSVLQPCRTLERRGWKLSMANVMSDGIVDLDYLSTIVSDDTALCSIMLANNEIGTIQPLAEIAALLKKKNIPLHTDACQALGWLPIDIHQLGCKLMTLNSGKVYGPKGVGALYVSSEVKMEPQLWGGHQESSHRASTENVAGIVGFGEACAIAVAELTVEVERVRGLRNLLLTHILAISGTRLNGSESRRLVNNINVSVAGVEPEALLLYLDQAGIAVSSGSACNQSDMTASHVLLSLGLDNISAQTSLRITLGRMTTLDDVLQFGSLLPKVVSKLRG